MNFSENDFCFSFTCKLCAVGPCVQALVQILSIIHLFGTSGVQIIGRNWRLIGYFVTQTKKNTEKNT